MDADLCAQNRLSASDCMILRSSTVQTFFPGICRLHLAMSNSTLEMKIPVISFGLTDLTDRHSEKVSLLFEKCEQIRS
jgi:hypothetical protein